MSGLATVEAKEDDDDEVTVKKPACVLLSPR